MVKSVGLIVEFSLTTKGPTPARTWTWRTPELTLLSAPQEFRRRRAGRQLFVGIDRSFHLRRSPYDIHFLVSPLVLRCTIGNTSPVLHQLCLAKGSVRKPHGVVEDVMVRIEYCYFLVDFLVINMKMIRELSQASIILGRTFLATAKAITDWEKGEVILKVGEHTMKVNINKLMKYPSRDSEELGAIDFSHN